ncbi:MAG: pilus assembly protein PilA [Bdellovibrio sp. CG10_big_fil_rev_8_21_14_0_10_47_8]|nr:MAG: pilus assembly protein PilA [Bdellovibrio sp. CG10_big_fil_rev_8_21_14_0_10_47_8]
MKRNVIRSQSGFSLVELMVVVAIIGILAAMSVGQVQKQIAKARQSEAKTNLSQLYTAEKSFYAEYNTYHSAFEVINLAYEGDLRYNVGFGATIAGVVLSDYGWKGVADPAGPFDAIAACTACTVLKNGTDAAALTAGAIATATTFVGEASSHIYNDQQDTWQMTNDKSLSQTVDGIQ